jgi:hypothetical protein
MEDFIPVDLPCAQVGDSQGETWRRGSSGSNIIGGTDVDELAINEFSVVSSFRS